MGRERGSRPSRVVKVCLMKAKSLIMRENREGSRRHNKIQRKGWTSGANADYRLIVAYLGMLTPGTKRRHGGGGEAALI